MKREVETVLSQDPVDLWLIHLAAAILEDHSTTQSFRFHLNEIRLSFSGRCIHLDNALTANLKLSAELKFLGHET